MQGFIRGLWAVDANGAVQPDRVKEVVVKGVKEKVGVSAVERAPVLKQTCSYKTGSLRLYRQNNLIWKKWFESCTSSLV